MSLVHLACPRCGGPFQADTAYAGGQVACPHCQGAVTIPDVNPAAAIPELAAATARREAPPAPIDDLLPAAAGTMLPQPTPPAHEMARGGSRPIVVNTPFDVEVVDPTANGPAFGKRRRKINTFDPARRTKKQFLMFL